MQFVNMLGSLNINEQGISLNLEQEAKFELVLKRLPTGGNAKPFTWNWTDKKLCIEHSNELAAHYLNRNNHTSLLALGCMITTVDITAKSMGLNWKAQFNETTLYTEIEFFHTQVSSRTQAENQRLYLQLQKRSTYRGEFKPSEIKTLETSFGKILAASKMNQNFQKYLIQCESYLFLQAQALKDFFKEIRLFSNKSSFEARGIAGFELGISMMDRLSLAVLQFVPQVLTWIRKTPGLNFQMVQAAKRTVAHSHFCLFSTKDLNPSSLIQVGRRAMLTWLELELQGFKVQPMSIASIPVLDSATGQLPSDTRPEFVKLYAEQGPQVMTEQFKLAKNQAPVWMFRFGTAK